MQKPTAGKIELGMSDFAGSCIETNWEKKWTSANNRAEAAVCRSFLCEKIRCL